MGANKNGALLALEAPAPGPLAANLAWLLSQASYALELGIALGYQR